MNDDELELGHYGRIFRRSWWIIALSVLGMVAISLFLLPGQRNFWESEATVRLVPSLGDVGRINDPINEDTEAIVAKSLGDKVVNEVNTNSPHTITLERWDEELLVTACLNTSALIVTNDCNTQILEFKYRSSSPEKTAFVLQTSIDAYLEERLERAAGIRDNTEDSLIRQLDDLDLRIETEEAILENAEPDSVDATLAEIRLRRIEPERLDLRSQVNTLQSTPLDVGSVLGNISTPSADASGVPRVFAILAGIMMGLLLGALAAILLDRLDRRVSSSAETELDLGVPVLGDIPRITEGAPALVTAVSSHAEGAEAFRRLAAAALAPRNGFVVDSIAVTGATDGEGRTTAAVNLALAISQTGRSVMLVAADRRNEAVDQIFGLSSEPGLSDYLRSKGDLDAARAAIAAAPQRLGITVMPTGNGATSPLSNNGIAALLAVAQERSMIVIFDAPPALTHADGLQIAAVVDAVYIVAAVGRTRRSELSDLRIQLLNVQADVVGSIINRNSRLSLLPGGYGDVGSVVIPTGVPGNGASAAPTEAHTFGARSSASVPQASPATSADLEVVEDADIISEVSNADDLEESA